MIELNEQHYLLIVFFVLAISIGWLLGFLQERRRNKKKRSRFYPLNWQRANFKGDVVADKLIDQILDERPESIEASIALGHVYRHRGELEKATQLHQNIMTEPSLTVNQRSQVMLALAQDYLCSGLFDRAENLFIKLLHSKEQIVSSLEGLIDIYEQTKDWRKAIKVSEQLENYTDEAREPVIAQYYCELAKQHWACGDVERAHEALAETLKVERYNPRALMMMADYYFEKNQYKKALKWYRVLIDKHPDYFVDVIDKIKTAIVQLQGPVAFMKFLRPIVIARLDDELVYRYVNELFLHEGAQKAEHFLEQHLSQRPGLKGVIQLLELKKIGALNEKLSRDFLVIQSLLNDIRQKRVDYQCQGCGLALKRRYWQCPKCRTWLSVKYQHHN